MRLIRHLAVFLALAVTACGTGSVAPAPTTTAQDVTTQDMTPFAVVASSNGSIGVGTQRVMFGLVDLQTDQFIASPDRPARVTLRDENGAPLETYETEFLWTIEDVRGLYVAYMDFPEPGTYQATIEAEGLGTAGPVGLMAFEDPFVVQAGDQAPRSVTKTSARYPDLAVISSDPEPDPAMYRVSVDAAVSNGTPAVIVFATPAWCVSQTCGPLLNQTKALRASYPTVDFVHVEVYDDIQVESFEDLVTVPAIEEWGLPSEPWVFVVDANGVVSASFEGAAADQELASAIDAVALVG